jgi:hypothetical protein
LRGGKGKVCPELLEHYRLGLAQVYSSSSREQAMDTTGAVFAGLFK